MCDLEVRDVVAFWHNRSLFRPVSFRVQRGEILRISGGNGVGKTTLLRIIAGLHYQWTGWKRCLLGPVSIKPQGVSVFPSLTLSQVLEILGVPPGEITSMAHGLCLEDKLNDAMGLLSDGESQRAMLLIALSRGRSVLLLDELFVGLDRHSSKLMMNVLGTKRNDIATLIVEHKATPGFQADSEVILEKPFDSP